MDTQEEPSEQQAGTLGNRELHLSQMKVGVAHHCSTFIHHFTQKGI
jgi:hypothetical protein